MLYPPDRVALDDDDELGLVRGDQLIDGLGLRVVVDDQGRLAVTLGATACAGHGLHPIAGNTAADAVGMHLRASGDQLILQRIDEITGFAQMAIANYENAETSKYGSKHDSSTPEK
ncbi:hypothetical protein [Paraburkholderia sp. 32]|uniref:hypothetical protein n=1 Tax=Paraburkholderia sp. 32 TaxID=2991057 RepID=UPI003D2459DA